MVRNPAELRRRLRISVAASPIQSRLGCAVWFSKGRTRSRRPCSAPGSAAAVALACWAMAAPENDAARTRIRTTSLKRGNFGRTRPIIVAMISDDRGVFLFRRLRPWRSDSVHAGVGDQLAHVLVIMNDDAQIDAVDRRCLVRDLDLLFEISG